MSANFSTLGLSESLTAALSRQNITTAFPIQEKAVPHILAGRDVQGRAPTGSGKTIAFGAPLLDTVKRAGRQEPRALILAPTRELAEQIFSDLSPLATAVDRRVSAIYGGVGYGGQIKALKRGVDVLVATPGRLEDLIDQGLVRLECVETVVVDEADRMADMGFLPAVRRILDRTAPKRQTLLFSATLDGDVAVVSREYQTDPVTVSADSHDDVAPDVEHHFWKVERSERVTHLARIIPNAERTIVFTRTRHGADRLAKQLGRTGIKAVAMHGGRNQNQRTRALKAFSRGNVHALVATDVAARGIHVEDVDLVVHYDIAGDHKDYVHRSGRTGRAGAAGTVITLVGSGQDREVRKIQRDAGMNAPITLPEHGWQRRTRNPHAGRSARTTRPHRGAAPTKEPGGGTDGESLRVYVGNLPWKTDDAALRDIFAVHGAVTSASVATKRPGRSKGYGFVEMAEVDAERAIHQMNGSKVDGRRIKVRKAW